MLRGVAYLIRFLPSQREVRVSRGANLLEAARDVGLPVASACGADGICGRCGLEIVKGAETLGPVSERETNVKERNRVDAKLRLACMVDVEGDLVVTAPYW